MEKKAMLNIDYKNYNELYQESIKTPEKFWERQSKRLNWYKSPSKILDSTKKPFYRWYPDAKVNITYNCLDRHAKETPNKVAFIYEGPIAKKVKKITYKDLLEQVEKFAGVLKKKGLKSGDTLIIYMPMIIESAIVFLACARLGIIHSCVFGGFSAKELASRIRDCKPKAIVSASCGLEPHKVIFYPKMIREAKELVGDSSLLTFYVDREEGPIECLKDNEFFYLEEMKSAEREKAVELDSNHPLYILYTSGTTGDPKGIYRDQGGTAVGVMASLDYGFGFTNNSIMFATSDIGWVVGHSYIIYGPLLFGATSVIYEGKPVGTPDVGEYFRIVEKYKIDVLYSSPTAIRAIRREDPEAEIIKKYNLNSLKVVGVVGERTDIYTYEFLKKIVPKDCLYNDTYWQTETGWFISANFLKPERFGTKGGSCTKSFPGYSIKIFGDDHKEIEKPKELGHVLIKLPMPPGFMLSIWGRDKAFIEKYLTKFPGYYQTGDAGYFDEDGYLSILTRTDDIIQVAGHRLSTAQMEEAVLNHKDLAEAVVVGLKDCLKGQVPFSMVVLKKGHKRDEKELFKEIIKHVRTEIGPVACLKSLIVVTQLPKTRSGKILRRTIRKIMDGEEWKMPPTIMNESAIDEILAIADKHLCKRKNNIEFGDKGVNSKKVKME